MGGNNAALTPKQEKYVQGLFTGLSQRDSYILKIDMVREVGSILGMFGKARGKETIEQPILIYELAEFYFKYATGFVQKYAVASLLDYFMPTWREIVGIENLGGITKRDSKEVRQWRKEVFARDGKACVICGNKENLQAHHIISWADLEETRTDVNNGVTLCARCHSEKHGKLSGFIMSHVKETVT